MIFQKENAILFFTMPNTQSAKENLRKDKKRYLINRKRKDYLKSAVKEIKKLILANEAEKAKEMMSQAYMVIDKAAKKGIIKKNTAARKKSRLVRFLYKSLATKKQI